jgi:OHCU decarboxylase
MVRADESGKQNHSARIDDLVRLRRDARRRPDRLDRAVLQQHRTVGEDSIVVVEGRDQRRMTEKQRRNGMTLPMTSIAALNAASRATFVAAIGFAFEDSPWIAEAAWDRRPFPDREALLAALLEVVHAAPEPQRIALIAAHPDLAGRVAREGRLTAASRDEQAAAGLDRLTDAERARFDTANDSYRERFGFPFVICAREHDTASILAALEARARNERNAEIETALAEIAKIAGLRLADALTS